ncbi:hypothetical protein PPACK8108_LOCUS2239 [Phakopsora pachyrhizi]|uniref:Uncharacterized protein n=1 Tax=Phakopsora pachyrhizi TaxID=170000 RepID=A0AAV0AIJ7_PHAPC|nr:hypothetical protein PPACK8108_LOCUS2239 [Phakopsora pachyrhizi]
MLLYYKKLRSKDYLEALEVVIQNYPDQNLLKATKLCLTLLVQVTLGTFTILLDSLLEQTYKIRDKIEYWSELKSDWLKAACYLPQTFCERIFYSIRNTFTRLNSLSSLLVQGSGVLTTVFQSSKTWSNDKTRQTFSVGYTLFQESILIIELLVESDHQLNAHLLENSGGLTERPKVQFSGLISCMSLATKVDSKEIQDLTLKKAKEEGLD